MPWRLHVWSVCALVCFVCLLRVLDAGVSQKAAAPVVARPALAAKKVVRFPGSVASHQSLRIPDGASRRPVRVQVAARPAAGVCGSRVLLFLGLG